MDDKTIGESLMFLNAFVLQFVRKQKQVLWFQFVDIYSMTCFATKHTNPGLDFLSSLQVKYLVISQVSQVWYVITFERGVLESLTVQIIRTNINTNSNLLILQTKYVTMVIIWFCQKINRIEYVNYYIWIYFDFLEYPKMHLIID